MTTFRHQTDLKRLHADILTAARIAAAPYDAERLWELLTAYADFFSGSSVSFRTSTRAPEQRELNVRYVELDVPHDPYLVALAQGFISRGGHPIDELMPEVQASYPILGYGVDVGAAYGLEKIWPFFPHQPQPVERVYSMCHMPASIKNYAPFFARYDLRVISLFGIDYRSRTVNLYFMKPPGFFTAETILRMTADLGLTLERQELPRYCSMAIPIYLTFSWNSPHVERLCFAAVAPELQLVPTHLDPVIADYVNGAPFASRRRVFIFNVTFTRHGDFVKIENDYTGSMAELMRCFVPPTGVLAADPPGA